MNQREFWDWFHKTFCPAARAKCQELFGEYAAFSYAEMISQCRTLFGYEGTCYSYSNYKAIFEGWMKDNFDPDILQWVEDDMKKHGAWDGRIEVM